MSESYNYLFMKLYDSYKENLRKFEGDVHLKFTRHTDWYGIFPYLRKRQKTNDINDLGKKKIRHSKRMDG